MAFCTSCGAQMADGAQFCPACGRAQAQSVGGGGAAAATAPSAQAGLQDNVAGMLAYITIIPAILFLVLEPYNKRRFVRFHSFQCIFVGLAWLAVNVVLGFIPILGWALSGVLALAGLCLWVVLLIKAYQGEMWKVPFIGDFAEQQANAM